MTDTQGTKPAWRHTPGPWESYSNSTRHVITAFDGNFAVAVLEKRNNCTLEEVQANALLLAAAPDLLEACRKLAAWDQSHDDAQLISEACSQARAALSKAGVP